VRGKEKQNQVQTQVRAKAKPNQDLTDSNFFIFKIRKSSVFKKNEKSSK
jgi:hypothetical protein